MFIEAKDDGGGGDIWTTGAISHAKLQSNHHHQQTNVQFFLQAGCPSCRPTNSVKALKGNGTYIYEFKCRKWVLYSAMSNCGRVDRFYVFHEMNRH